MFWCSQPECTREVERLSSGLYPKKAGKVLLRKRPLMREACSQQGMSGHPETLQDGAGRAPSCLESRENANSKSREERPYLSTTKMLQEKGIQSSDALPIMGSFLSLQRGLGGTQGPELVVLSKVSMKTWRVLGHYLLVFSWS